MNSKMLFYILKRVLLALLTIWIVITVTFFVMHSIPGGPFASEKAISAEAQAALEAARDAFPVWSRMPLEEGARGS